MGVRRHFLTISSSPLSLPSSFRGHSIFFTKVLRPFFSTKERRSFVQIILFARLHHHSSVSCFASSRSPSCSSPPKSFAVFVSTKVVRRLRLHHRLDFVQPPPSRVRSTTTVRTGRLFAHHCPHHYFSFRFFFHFLLYISFHFLVVFFSVFISVFFIFLL